MYSVTTLSVKNVQNILKEMKFRIAWILISLLVTSICSYIFSEELLFLLAKPFLLSFFQDKPLVFQTENVVTDNVVREALVFQAESPAPNEALICQPDVLVFQRDTSGLTTNDLSTNDLPTNDLTTSLVVNPLVGRSLVGSPQELLNTGKTKVVGDEMMSSQSLSSQANLTCKTVTTDRIEPAQYQFQPEQESVAFFLSTQLTETLNTYLTTSLVLSCFFCIPHLVYQAWCFFIPSCYIYERHSFIKIFFLSILFCFAAFSFCVTCLLPNVWHFLYEINRTTTSIFVIQLQPKIYDFIMLTIHVLVSMFICSQTLVILITLIKYKKIHARDLIQHRKYVVFFAILVTALITPPDFLSQFSALLPFLVVLESIVFYSILHHFYRFGAKLSDKRTH